VFPNLSANPSRNNLPRIDLGDVAAWPNAKHMECLFRRGCGWALRSCVGWVYPGVRGNRAWWGLAGVVRRGAALCVDALGGSFLRVGGCFGMGCEKTTHNPPRFHPHSNPEPTHNPPPNQPLWFCEMHPKRSLRHFCIKLLEVCWGRSGRGAAVAAVRGTTKGGLDWARVWSGGWIRRRRGLRVLPDHRRPEWEEFVLTTGDRQIIALCRCHCALSRAHTATSV
jgi:hypothetical protein